MTTALEGRRPKGRAREEALVKAAAAAIADLGLANVRVSDIAERAGIGTGHVTYYFPSKDDLLMLAIRRSEEELHERIASEVERIADPWKRLRSLIELAMADGPGDPGWVLWFDVWSRAAVVPEVASGSSELETWWRTSLDEVIAFGVSRGDFEVADQQEAGLILSSLIEGLSIRLTLGQADLTKKKAVDVCVRMARSRLSASGG